MKSSQALSYALVLALSAFVPSLLTSQTPPAQRPAPRPRAAVAPAPGAAGTAKARSGPGARDGDRGADHPAAILLRSRTQLSLTDDQVKRLEALAAAPAPKSNAADIRRAQADLIDATQGDGNLAGARAALDKLSRLRNDQVLARIKTQQEVRAVLTPMQRTKVDNMRRQRRSRVGAKGQGGMRQERGQMGPGMMPGNPQGPPGPKPRMRRGGGTPGSVPPVPPA